MKSLQKFRQSDKYYEIMKRKISMTNKVCRRCMFYEPLYWKVTYTFWNADAGVCAVHKKYTEKKNFCTQFRPAEKSVKISVQMLEEAEEDVKILLSFFREEQ